jgi:hypothetical protein
MLLDHSIVMRGGYKSDYMSTETRFISCSASLEGLEFRFKLSAAGGGDTMIWLTVDRKDLEQVLKELAEKCPSLAEAFAESTRIVVSGLVKDQQTNRTANPA